MGVASVLASTQQPYTLFPHIISGTEINASQQHETDIRCSAGTREEMQTCGVVCADTAVAQFGALQVSLWVCRPFTSSRAFVTDMNTKTLNMLVHMMGHGHAGYKLHVYVCMSLTVY